METFEVAHVREQGVDLIITVVSPSFGHKSNSDQESATLALQACAESAGLAGTVVPVWEESGGRLRFYAPTRWHSFFQSLDPLTLAASINRKLTCSF